jgi:DNA primase
MELLEAAGCRRVVSRMRYVTATCPNEEFHGNSVDKNPSFSVLINDSGASYCRCFTCGLEGVLEKFAHEWGFDGYDNDNFKKSNYIGRLKALGEYDPRLNLKHWGKTVDSFYYDFLPGFSLKPFEGCCPRYILDRGITLESVKRWSIGYDKKNKRAILVVRDLKKRLCGVTGRSIVNKDPKYLYYSWDMKNARLEPYIDYKRESDFQRFRKSHFLFGEHLIDYSRGDIVIVEGHLDAVKVDQSGFHAVATMGTQFSDVQVKKICDLIPNGKFAILMLDGDKAGREATEKLESKLESSGVLIKKVRLPDDTDPGDFSEEDLIGFISEASIY